jgi:hypothetical protein
VREEVTMTKEQNVYLGSEEKSPATISWIVNFIGVEGFRENFRVESDNATDLAERREATLKLLVNLGAVPDVRKLFDDNGSKPGKLSKYAGTGEKSADAMEAAAKDSGIIFEKPTTVSKLARFKTQISVAPAQAVVTASAPNVPPKLSRFVAKEKEKGD